MKHIILTLGIISLIAFSQFTSAQNSDDLAINYRTSKALPGGTSEKKSVKVKATPMKSKMTRDFSNSNKNLVEIPVSEVNIKAVRDFSRSHKDESPAKWYKSTSGFIAGFSSNGKETKIVYDAGGRWFYNLHAYNESKLPFDIRELVKSKYYDSDILVVYEYEFENRTVFMIRLSEVNSMIRTLTVCNGEIEDITTIQHK